MGIIYYIISKMFNLKKKDDHAPKKTNSRFWVCIYINKKTLPSVWLIESSFNQLTLFRLIIYQLTKKTMYDIHYILYYIILYNTNIIYYTNNIMHYILYILYFIILV